MARKAATKTRTKSTRRKSGGDHPFGDPEDGADAAATRRKSPSGSKPRAASPALRATRKRQSPPPSAAAESPPRDPAVGHAVQAPLHAPRSDDGKGTGDELFANGHVALKRCRHGWFMFNRNDQFVSRSLDRYGEWCEAELEILSPLLRAGRVVLDIGAFIGSHTVYFAQKVAPGGRVYSVEPQRHAFQMLCGNVALNGLTNVTCVPAVAGREGGWRDIGEISQVHSGNFGAAKALIVPKGEPTRVICVDELGLTRCDLIKIDVEGMESEVLDGARQTIERFRPVIYCENNRIEQSPAILQILAAHGYRVWWHFVGYYNPANFFGEKENVFAPYRPEANILCVPASSRIVVRNLLEVAGSDDNWQKALSRLQGKGRSPAPVTDPTREAPRNAS